MYYRGFPRQKLQEISGCGLESRLQPVNSEKSNVFAAVNAGRLKPGLQPSMHLYVAGADAPSIEVELNVGMIGKQ